MRTFILFILGLFVLCYFGMGCLLNRPSDKRVLSDLSGAPYPASIHYYEKDDYTISYVEVAKDDKLPVVLLIHGAPGTFYDYEDLLRDTLLTSVARLIAVDRPGYGRSTNKACIVLEDVSKLLQPLLELDKSGKGSLVVGHSYGGPIAARMAADYPSQVSGLVLAAAAVDPANEKLFWFNKPLQLLGLKYFLPRPLRIAQDEKMSHAGQLELLEDSWSKITVPVGIIHGMEDQIVPIENGYYAESALEGLPVKTLFKADMSHMIPWESPIELRNMILELLLAE